MLSAEMPIKTVAGLIVTLRATQRACCPIREAIVKKKRIDSPSHVRDEYKRPIHGNGGSHRSIYATRSTEDCEKQPKNYTLNDPSDYANAHSTQRTLIIKRLSYGDDHCKQHPDPSD